MTGFVFVGKHSHNVNSSKTNATIRIGSKDFTENLVVAEIYALALEDNGYKVQRVSNISSSLIHRSLINKEIDLYPEYTGTGLDVYKRQRPDSSVSVAIMSSAILPW